MNGVGELQLLPSQNKKLYGLHFSGHHKLLTIAVVCFLLLGAGYGGMILFEHTTKNAIDALDAQIVPIYEHRDKAVESKLMNFQKQLAMTRSLLAAHIFWLTEIKNVQELIEPQVTFGSLTADAKRRSYQFHATADSYATVAKQVASFYKSPVIDNLTISQISAGPAGRYLHSL